MAEGARGLKKPGLAWSHAPECSCSSQGGARHAARGAARKAQKGPKIYSARGTGQPRAVALWLALRPAKQHGAVLPRATWLLRRCARRKAWGRAAAPWPRRQAPGPLPRHGATARPRTLLCTTTRRRAVSLSWLATGCSALGARCSVQQHGAVLFFICRKGAQAPELRSRWPRAVLKGLILEPACGAREGLASLAPKREANREATHQEA